MSRPEGPPGKGAGGALRERLGELVRRRRANAVPGRPAGPEATGDTEVARFPPSSLPPSSLPPSKPKRRRRISVTDPGATGVDAFLPGGEWHHERHGSVYVHERLRSDVERRRGTWGRLPEPPPGEVELSSLRHLGL